MAPQIAALEYIRNGTTHRIKLTSTDAQLNEALRDSAARKALNEFIATLGGEPLRVVKLEDVELELCSAD